MNRRAFLELQEADGIEGLGHVKWDQALCLFLVYAICYFSLWKGISTSGRVRTNQAPGYKSFLFVSSD